MTTHPLAPGRAAIISRLRAAGCVFAEDEADLLIADAQTPDQLEAMVERRVGGEPLRTAYAVAEPNQHRAVALFKLRPDHTADEQVEAVVELTQSALDSLGLKPGMIKPL